VVPAGDGLVPPSLDGPVQREGESGAGNQPGGVLPGETGEPRGLGDRQLYGGDAGFPPISSQKVASVRVFRPLAAMPWASGRRRGMPEGIAIRRPYPSDLSDVRWALVEPTLTAWRERERRAGPGIGRPPRHDLRCVLDAILYVDRTGIPGATSRMSTYQLLGIRPSGRSCPVRSRR